jgi:protein pelota
MHVISRELNKGSIKLGIDNELDLWHLTHVLRKGDFIEAKTYRVVEFEKEQEKKPVFMRLEVGEIEFSPYVSRLRVSGIIRGGSPEEFIQLGRHHSMDISEGDVITVIKEKWLNYELERVEEAVKEAKKERVYIILIDERKALLAVAFPYGFEVKTEFENKASKRMKEKEISKEKKDFYQDIMSTVPKKVYLIVAGPGFEKDYFSDYLKANGYNPVKKSASYVEASSLREIVDESESLIVEQRLKQESEIYEELARHVFKGDGYGVYGKEEVSEALDRGAVDLLAISDDLLRDTGIEAMLKKADGEGSRIFIFSSKTEWGDKIKGLGGVVAKLRYRIKD